jgi:hypothetical protein
MNKFFVCTGQRNAQSYPQQKCCTAHNNERAAVLLVPLIFYLDKNHNLHGKGQNKDNAPAEGLPA